jgi:hypothetical protein
MHNTWISVDECSPPLGTPILVHAWNGDICSVVIDIFEADAGDEISYSPAGLGDYYEDFAWGWRWERANKPWNGITHWMVPLVPSNK